MGQRFLIYQLWFAMTLVAAVACSSDDKPKDPDLEPVSDPAEPGDGALDGEPADKPSQENSESDGETSEQSLNANGDGNSKSEKKPITDDGYDDDWNNKGSQQQQQQQQQQKADQQTTDLSDTEPPLTNATQNIPPEPNPNPELVTQFAVEPPFDPEPAPIFEQQALPEPEPVAVPQPPPSPLAPGGVPVVVSGPPLVKPDVKPVFASLIWVGYDHVERDGVARVEIVTRGAPRFNLFQERNQRDQPELVIRFFQTVLRDKLRRDINASEFRSPVAFIRLRPDETENHVDVIITLRDAVQPRMYSKHGDVMLTFPLPDHYFGNNTIGDAPVAKAEVLPNSNIMPEFDDGSDISEGMKVAKAFITNPGADAFQNAPANGGDLVTPEAVPVDPNSNANPEGLPPDFGTPVPDQTTPAPNNVPIANTTNPTSDNLIVNNTQANLGNNLFPASQPAMEGQGLNPQANGQNFDIDGDAGFPELDGELGAPGDNFDLAEPVNNAQTQQAFPANEIDAVEQGEEESDDFNEDTLEDFDDGEGESSSEIEKFDVRLRKILPHFAAILFAPSLQALTGQDLVARSRWEFVDPSLGTYDFAISGVAQDDLENTESAGDDFGDEQGDGAANNFGANNNLGGGNTALGNNNTGVNSGNAAFNGGNAAFNGGNAAFNGGNAALNAGGALNSAANAGVVNAASAIPVQANVAPFNNADINATAASGGVIPGEPPVSGEPDLAGEEQFGSDAEAAPTPSSGGRPVKLDFRGAPLTEVIRMLADESGVNFVFPPEIGAKEIYVNLTGVPFNDALKALLEANALGMLQIAPNVVRIDTLEKLAADKEAEEKRKKAEVKLQPTKVLVYRLSYAKVDEAQKMLAEMLGAAAKDDNRISVQLDTRTNSIIVNAPPNELAMVKALLERIDLETPQVKIAARIVEVQKKFQELFGISWAPTFNFDQGRGLGFGNLPFPNSVNSRFAVDGGGTAPSTGNFGVRFGSINNAMTLDLALSMEESRSTVEILQSSNLIVEDNAEAEIVAGSSDFFRGAPRAAGAAEEVIEVTYNLNMKVQPHITADGAVQMKVTLESDSPAQPQTQGGQAIAAKNNRSVTTSLLRRSGETAVIGGIYNTQKQKGSAGVPGLMNIPIIGALFRKSNENEEKRELLVMVTPTILVGAGAKGGIGDPEPDGEGEIAANVQNLNNASADQSNFGLNVQADQTESNNTAFGSEEQPAGQNDFGAQQANPLEENDATDEQGQQQNGNIQQAIQQGEQPENQQVNQPENNAEPSANQQNGFVE